MSTVILVFRMTIWPFIGLFLACFFISGITGDVPDGVVYTDLHQSVQLGSRAVLKCEFYGAPIAVYWKKGDNPSTAPNLITWGKDGPDSGSCVKDKTCEMGDDYSLIIKNVSIANQGRYICRISNYRGILLHNFTDVKVLALLEEPYPIIDECKENQGGNCIFLATDPVNITCTVLKYFPNVDLFFLHGVKKYSTADTLEWINTDGTKSKSIFTTAPPSEIPYGCVAFNIPGSQEQRTVTFKVTFQDNVTTTQTGVPVKRDKISVVIIVVPIIAVTCIAAGILFLMIYRKRRGREKKDDVEATPLVSQRKIKGRISYYDVWLLVRHLMLGKNSEMLRDTLRELSVPNIPEMLSGQEAYELLCKWKEDNRMDNEAEILEDTLKIVLNKKDYNKAWNDVCENRENSSVEIDSHTFEHILWNISGIEKIKEFLKELISHRTSVPDYTGKKADIVQLALKELTEWSNDQLELNPFVLLSSALERVGCRLLARTFFFMFLVPGHLTSPLEQTAIKGIVRKLTSRHCKRLTSGKISSDKIVSTIDENDNMLFDTSAMITDWFDQLECSNYEKRCRLDDAIIKIGRYDMQDCLETVLYRPSLAYHQEHLHLSDAQLARLDHGSVFDDDIHQLVKLVKYIPPDKLSGFSKKTGLSADRDDSNIEQELKKKRDDILARSTSKAASLKEFTSLRDKFKEHSKDVDFTLIDEELNDVVAQVTSTDKQQQLIRKLHISADAQQSFADQLKKWRNTETKANCRKDLQESLKQIGFRECIVYKNSKKFLYHAELSNIALNLLMEDVRPIIDALAIDGRKVSLYIKPVSKQDMGTKRLVKEFLKSKTRDDFCKALRNIGFVDVSRSVYFDYEPSLSELIHIVDCVGNDDMDRFLEHLDLGADDIEDCRDSERQIDKLKLMRLWKRQIRPVPCHYRLEIAAALRASGLNEIANSVISGDHRQKMPNPDVIKDICCRLDDVMRNEICKLLKETSSLKEEESTALVINWVNRWISEYRPTDTGFMSRWTAHMEERKSTNDTLFNSGMHELAEEISALENSHLK